MEIEALGESTNQTVEKGNSSLKCLTSGMKELGLHDPESKDETQQTQEITSSNNDDAADYGKLKLLYRHLFRLQFIEFFLICFSDENEDTDEYIPHGTARYLDNCDYVPPTFDIDQPGIFEIPLQFYINLL